MRESSVCRQKVIFVLGLPDTIVPSRNAEESTQKSPQWGNRQENEEQAKCLEKSGEPRRTRTCNPLIKSQLLYH
jgi:hypothetical protein